MKVSATAAKNAVEPERIAKTEDIRGRIAIEVDTDVKIDLLIVVDAVACAGIEQLIIAATGRESADIFGEQKGALGDLLFDHESRLIGKLDGRCGRKEIRFHAGKCPAATKVQRPRNLQIGLHAWTRHGTCSSGQCGSGCNRDVEPALRRIELPFYRRRDIAK